MVDVQQTINSGEQAVNAPPASIAINSDAQFRTLSRRLEEVADQVSRVQPQQSFRLADTIQLAAIVTAFVVAVLTAWGLKDRIDDLVKVQSATETRLSSQLSAAESRITARVDRLDDRVGQLGERTATIEGQRPARR